MALTKVNGYDGYFSATTAHNGSITTWQADFSRVESDVTAFGQNGRDRILGVWDVQGSASGAPTYDASNTKPGINTSNWSRVGTGLTLGVVGSTVCYYSVTAVMSNIGINNNHNGDTGLTFNFKNSSGSIPAETWDETP